MAQQRHAALTRAALAAVMVGLIGLVVAAATVSPSTATPRPRAEIPAPVTPRAVERPLGAAGALRWFRAPAPDGREVTLGHAAVPGAAATIVWLHPTGGLTRDDEAFATALAGAGFDTVVACWFATPTEQIACPNGPEYRGVSADAVPNVDAVVAAAKQLPGVRADRIVVAGFSRGGGVALLRATRGATEPVIAMSPLVIGSAWLTPEVDDDVELGVGALRAPAMMIVASNDAFVPSGQQAVPFAAAAAVAGNRVALRTYAGGHHGVFLEDPDAQMWAIDQMRSFIDGLDAPRVKSAEATRAAR